MQVSSLAVAWRAIGAPVAVARSLVDRTHLEQTPREVLQRESCLLSPWFGLHRTPVACQGPRRLDQVAYEPLVKRLRSARRCRIGTERLGLKQHTP